MRRHNDEAVRRRRDFAAGIDQRDRGAVAVAEQDRPAHIQRVQQIRQHVLAFPVHEVERQRQVGAGQRVGFAVAAPAVDQHAQAGRSRNPGWEIAPHGDGAEALVQHDDGRPVRRSDPHPFILKPASAGFHKGPLPPRLPVPRQPAAGRRPRQGTEGRRDRQAKPCAARPGGAWLVDMPRQGFVIRV